MVPLPNLLAAFVGKDGKIKAPWNFFLQQFTQAPPKFLPITVGASPFSYAAKEPGLVGLAGGTISDASLIRGDDTISLSSGTNKIIPVSINDVVKVTYSVLPNLIFIPNYGNRTG